MTPRHAPTIAKGKNDNGHRVHPRSTTVRTSNRLEANDFENAGAAVRTEEREIARNRFKVRAKTGGDAARGALYSLPTAGPLGQSDGSAAPRRADTKVVARTFARRYRPDLRTRRAVSSGMRISYEKG